MLNLLVVLFNPQIAYAGTLFTMPDASTTLNGVGAYAGPIFTDFLPLIYIILGVLVIAFILGVIIRAFTHH